MSDHPQKAIADEVVVMAENAIAGLELSIKHWPAEHRAIIWDAVADIASRRADAARQSWPNTTPSVRQKMTEVIDREYYEGMIAELKQGKANLLADAERERVRYERAEGFLAEDIYMLRAALVAIRATDDIEKIHIEALAALSRS